jgi:hypothetical protein
MLPAVQPHRDLPQLIAAAEVACLVLEVPVELVIAMMLVESSWRANAYRYEPNFDRRYISRRAKVPGELRPPYIWWASDPAWIGVGITARQWAQNQPKRAGELGAGHNWDFVAQTRLAASYGPLQIMYPTATEAGYVGLPEGLYGAAGIQWGAAHLRKQLVWARTRYPEGDALQVAFARYNGGSVGNAVPGHLRNQTYANKIRTAYINCWDTPPW